jgi:hypothetical protein
VWDDQADGGRGGEGGGDREGDGVDEADGVFVLNGMVPSKDDAAAAIRVVLGKLWTPENLALLDRIVDEGGGPELVSLLLSEAAFGETPEKRVRSIMGNLESLGEASAATACTLMINLWGPAGNLFMHDVADAIDLWLYHHPSTRVTKELVRLVRAEGHDLGEQRNYERLLVRAQGSAT